MHLESIEQISAQYRGIYLQPHFDDAALSCGGALGVQQMAGLRTLVITVFGGAPPAGTAISPFATQNLQRMGLSLDPKEAVRQRREEDAAALELLGADTLWLDYPDAILRGTPPFYASEEALFGTVNSGDLNIDSELATLLPRIHELAPLAVIYAPLGIGHHVDHQLCCSAADRLAQRKVNVKFYEDFPYVSRSGALAARQKDLGISMEPEWVEISGVLRTKEEAIARYSSQVPQLFQGEDR
ncbi:MAG TPA: PIG-L family deacetylase, partial [Ktedonobacterales bacterium]|nr:PIG-L family deacetylase [Ktedonobacterales bacterium]